ncbi:hypothetical protein QFX18_11535 [Saccharophagus degradans]|uniref:hypothetical protein n=1 Tax=Saccharophagus degradans TaxID=86304 RepID=UPI0024782036|nr:hypothetical protein [Saccharophagus degradans]WGO96678.1 hypothetical protein QFX18_11535 [Saccharophagus degradans]
MNNWHVEETYKSLIQISTVVMRFILTANGGAIIALLAFAGNIHAKGQTPPNFKFSIGAFLFGVLLGGLTCAFSYVTQLQLYRESRDGRDKQYHHYYLYPAMVFAFAGICCFGVGSWAAVSAYNF